MALSTRRKKVICLSQAQKGDFRELLILLGVSQGLVADQAGIRRPTLSEITNPDHHKGIREPNWHRIITVLKELVVQKDADLRRAGTLERAQTTIARFEELMAQAFDPLVFMKEISTREIELILGSMGCLGLVSISLETLTLLLRLQRVADPEAEISAATLRTTLEVSKAMDNKVSHDIFRIVLKEAREKESSVNQSEPATEVAKEQ